MDVKAVKEVDDMGWDIDIVRSEEAQSYVSEVGPGLNASASMRKCHSGVFGICDPLKLKSILSFISAVVARKLQSVEGMPELGELGSCLQGSGVHVTTTSGPAIELFATTSNRKTLNPPYCPYWFAELNAAVTCALMSIVAALP